MEDVTIDTARKEAEEMKKKYAERKAKKEAEKKARSVQTTPEKPEKLKKEPQFDNITDETAYREAQEMKAKYAESREGKGPTFWERVIGTHGSRTPAGSSPAPALEKSPGTSQERPVDTIENSIEAQANAKPGDVVNGHVLTQADIEWAKKQLAGEQQEPETEPKATDTISDGDISVSEADDIENSNIANPEIEEAKPDLNSPEVQKAIGAGGAEIEDAQDDETKQADFKQKYCNAIWENYDIGMSKQPQFKPGWQLPATILSIGLSVFSGGLVPPVNFMKLTGKEEEYNAAMDMWKETMGKSGDLAQEQERSSTMPTAKAEGMEAAKGTASQDAIDQAAEVNAAESGAQAEARLGTEGELETMASQAEIDTAMEKLRQSHEEKMKNLDQAGQERIAQITATLNKDLANAAAANDMAKIRQLYQQTVQQHGDEMRYLGYDLSPKGFLEYTRNSGGDSKAMKIYGKALETVDSIGNLAGNVSNFIPGIGGL